MEKDGLKLETHSSLIFSWILREVGAPLLEKLPWIDSSDSQTKEWYQIQAVLRVSLGIGLACFSYYVSDIGLTLPKSIANPPNVGPNNYHGYIKRRSALLQPSVLARPDEQRQNQQQNQQQVDIDLNATANGSQESASRNAETGGTQNVQPNSGGNNSGGRRSTSAFDRLGPGNPGPRPFGGISSDDTQIKQDLRHRMQAMELEVKELRKENTELKNVAQDLRARRCSPHRCRERSKSCSPSRRRSRSPPRRRRGQNSLENPYSSSDESHEGRRRRPRRYKRMRNHERTPPIDGHTPFSSRILKV
ncbi:hypothetical protein PIB30_000851 [Stylosanthes scabra]|uniref:Uncharacterized protein n=1 Tax=Stylosanthes scabra TaxID=79078 RepID=A0ABU6R1I0_9FABA|nr:hypothetical protein [Stylosanthes scabra]